MRLVTRACACAVCPKAWSFALGCGLKSTSTATSQFRTSIRQASPHAPGLYGNEAHDLVLRFGNDWMVAAPQFMTTSTPSTAAQGNLWMRVPQAKVMYNKNLGEIFLSKRTHGRQRFRRRQCQERASCANPALAEHTCIPLRGPHRRRIQNRRREFSRGHFGIYQKLDFPRSPTSRNRIRCARRFGA